ncbi:arsenate reductase (glutaredoxin) [Paracoccus sediminilitoris]|uniref:arsenate reductase (glutaredoxin) n=1 Tax=Paracoccus sediminilitoris TaxID=2202419 RepID=UPI000DB91959|nr:arsenate reductase (glutaredoxin) [Paracoccus sediminilitoris]
MAWTIWHKPTCSTSRFVLNALREAGIDVTVRDYIKDAPSVVELEQALALLGIGPRGLLRRKGTPFDELGLSDPALDDAALIAAMAEHPILIERPVVFGPEGAVLCRPKERIFNFLP